MSEATGGGPADFAAGSQIAGYRLEEQIGLGGMAVVFRAHDSRLDRRVALKIMAPALARDDAFRQRFMRESRAAAAVDDPHIIPVYEAGEERGVLFIAMRFVRGGDVRSLLDRSGPLPPARACEIIAQAASALDSAHARGLVHRDVKPANMLLEERQEADRPDHVYLSDFGLAKASLAMADLTSTGQFVGTLDYVAPEQVEGRPLDGQADQYALACVTFELLTGAPPFRRPDPMAVIHAQVSEAPPLVSSRRPGVPAGVDRVVARGMAKARAQRFGSCREFASELRRAFGPAASPAGDRPAARSATQVANPVHPATPAHPATAVPAVTPAYPATAVPAVTPAHPATAVPAVTPAYPATAVPAAAGPTPEPPTEAVGDPIRDPARGRDQWPAQVPSAGPERSAWPPQPLVAPPRPGYASRGDTVGVGAPGGLAGQQPPRPGRRWWRSPVPLALACAVVLAVGGGGGYYLAGHHGKVGQPTRRTDAVLPPLQAPGCSAAVPDASQVSGASLSSVGIGGAPFGIATSGAYEFVTFGGGIAVLRSEGGPAPVLLRKIFIQNADKGLWLTADGKYLLAAGGSGAVVLSVAEAESGAASPVLGSLASPRGNGAIGVMASPDGRFAFVTLQNTTTMAVFNLASALASGFGQQDFVGFVPLGVQPDGIGSSPDGKWLYVTSFERTATPVQSEGTLSVVSMHGAETSPAASVVSVVDAGCSPARVITAGQVVWVTARDSDTLIAFSADLLRTRPSRAILAEVPVGSAPIGEQFVRGGTRIVVADTNLHSKQNASGSLAIVSTARALAREPALLGFVPADGQPRQPAVTDGGATLLMVNQVSGLLQALPVRDLP